MASKYSQLPLGAIFDARGGKFRKVDDLYYEDLNTGFQAVWNPVFDEGIAVPGATPPPPTSVNSTDKYLIDPQNRLMRPNPNYKNESEEASKWMGVLFARGGFSENLTYEQAVDYCLQAIDFMLTVEGIVGIHDESEKLYDKLHALMFPKDEKAEEFELQPVRKPAKKKVPAKKKAAKKPAKKGKK